MNISKNTSHIASLLCFFVAGISSSASFACEAEHLPEEDNDARHQFQPGLLEGRKQLANARGQREQALNTLLAAISQLQPTNPLLQAQAHNNILAPEPIPEENLWQDNWPKDLTRFHEDLTKCLMQQEDLRDFQRKGICSLLLFGSRDSGKTALAKSYINLMLQPLCKQQNTPIDFYHIRPAAKEANLARLYTLTRTIKNSEGHRFTVIFIERIDTYLDPTHENISTIAALKFLMDDTALGSSCCLIAEAGNPFKLPGTLLDRMTMVETPLPDHDMRKSLLSDFLKKAMYCYSRYRELDLLVKHTTGYKYRDLERLKRALKDVYRGFDYEAATSALCKSWPMNRRVPDELHKCMIVMQLSQAGIRIRKDADRVRRLSEHLKTSTKKEISATMYQIRDRQSTSSFDVNKCIDEVLAERQHRLSPPNSPTS